MIAIASRPNSSRRAHTEASDSIHTSHRFDAGNDECFAEASSTDSRAAQSEARTGCGRFLTALLRALSMPGA